MNLNPYLLQTLTRFVGLTFTQGLMTRVGPADAFALTLTALYMSKDDESRMILETNLEKYGDAVVEIWHRWFEHVVNENQAGINASELDVHALLRRVLNEDNGQGAGSQS